ncbi:MAG: citryl-CoA lyase [Candidatus Woesearchaeota archaeon]|nr:citryl-CoA lyase [Candidatus Woesearchaeota archaeon]
MNYTTSISKLQDEEHIIRGETLSDLTANASFSDAVFLLLGKRMPDEQESKIFNAILVSCCDHGMGVASSQAARFVASTGNDLNTAAAAGILALGKYHGGAISAAMQQFQCVAAGNDDAAASFVKESLAKKQVIFGYGHKVHKDADPRVTQINDMCKEHGYESKFIDLAFAIEQELEQQKGKKIILNIDGFIAAILCEMGFSTKAGNGVFYVARLPSLVANAVEEQENEKPVRRVDEKEITYKE